MSREFAQCSERLGDYAYQAIQKHFKKSIKHEAEVVADRDPEALHQMRVGMRRLRTALNVFAPALELPDTVSDARIKKIAHRLGSVRDLDVLKAKLTEKYRPDLHGKEQKRLDEVLETLEQQRQHDFARTRQMLQGNRYQAFQQDFTDWLADPEYQPIAALPILQTLPDLLLPLISQLLLHPGWLVGTQADAGTLTVAEPSLKTVKRWLARQSEPLHDLRKQMKQVRYQTEFFIEFYGSDYRSQTDDFQAVQEVLGQIQDYSVLKEFLATALDQDWQKDLPTLSQRLEHEQISLWEVWQPMQQRYLDAAFRDRLRQLMLTPQPAVQLAKSAHDPKSETTQSQPRKR